MRNTNAVSDESDDGTDLDFVTAQFWKCNIKKKTKPTPMENCDLKLETETKLCVRSRDTCSTRRTPDNTSVNILSLLSKRTLSGKCHQNVKRNILNNFLPKSPSVVAQYSHKVFCGNYCGVGGNTFMTASQDCLIRLYDTQQGNFALTETLEARDVGWSVLDVAVSHAGDCLVYSSWNENLHLVNLSSETGDKDRQHLPLPLAPDDVQFCLFCVTFSDDDSEIIGGSNDGCIYIYDRGVDRRTNQIHAHHADVNTVCFMDQNTNVLASGADDGLCKIWDRRSLREDHPTPVGVLAGHVDGIAYISPKGDGRYLISNSKDQSIKLWDLRKFSNRDTVESGLRAVSGQRWDYRWQRVPKYVAKSRGVVTGDSSVMTYTGHTVLQTLIRYY